MTEERADFIQPDGLREEKSEFLHLRQVEAERAAELVELVAFLDGWDIGSGTGAEVSISLKLSYLIQKVLRAEREEQQSVRVKLPQCRSDGSLVCPHTILLLILE